MLLIITVCRDELLIGGQLEILIVLKAKRDRQEDESSVTQGYDSMQESREWMVLQTFHKPDY